MLYVTDSISFNISSVNITDGEWHDIEWTRMRNLTSLDHVFSVVVDGSVTSSASMSGDINQLAINGTAYFHIAGLSDFDNVQSQPSATGINISRHVKRASLSKMKCFMCLLYAMFLQLFSFLLCSHSTFSLAIA